MSSLVTLGLFILIIHGLILALMPTAFMWGTAYVAARSLFSDNATGGDRF